LSHLADGLGDAPKQGVVSARLAGFGFVEQIVSNGVGWEVFAQLRQSSVMLHDIRKPLFVHIEDMLQTSLSTPTDKLHRCLIGSVMLRSETVSARPLNECQFCQVAQNADVRRSETKRCEATEPFDGMQGHAIDDDIAPHDDDVVTTNAPRTQNFCVAEHPQPRVAFQQPVTCQRRQRR
jgi:hypothetical protein